MIICSSPEFIVTQVYSNVDNNDYKVYLKVDQGV